MVKQMKVSNLDARNWFSRGIVVKCISDGEELFKTNKGEPGVTGTLEFVGNWVIPAGLHIHCVHTCIIDACIVCTHACVMPGRRK